MKLLAATESYETYAAKYGVKAANIRFKPCGRGLVAARPLLLAAMDHTRVDYFVVVDVDGFRLLGRPWLTLLIDVHSRCILGWVLGFEPPSLHSALECLKQANRPKLWLRSSFPDEPALVEIFGKPDEVIVDNGWEFTGVSFESALIDAGISVRWAPVKSPTYKAVVERFFGTLNTLLHQRLPGRTFPIAQMRAWDLRPEKDAVLTLDQAESLLTHAIATYHQSCHSTLGDTPLNVWRRGIQQMGGSPVIGDDRQLEKMIGVEDRRRLTRSGIALFGLEYHDPAVTGPLLERLAARQPSRDRRVGSANPKVKLKYNPANLGQIHVWDSTTAKFETLPCTDPEYAEGLSKWQHERIREWSSEKRAHNQDAERERRLELRRQIEALEPPHLRRQKKSALARLLSSPKATPGPAQHVSIAYAEPRHDGLGPVIPMAALAEERTDDHVKPVRAPRGGKRLAPKSRPSSPKSAVDAPLSWTSNPGEATNWEDFQ